MKTKFTILSLLVMVVLTSSVAPAFSQACSSLVILSLPNESRCMATGSILVKASGGSGSYNYKVSGPLNTTYTSSNRITGLSAGNYTVTVKDIVTGCVKDMFDIIVTGSYTDPRFTLVKTDETCLNSRNGTVTVTGLAGGRGPFTYTIVAPSPASVGVSNANGIFTGLRGGDYSIQLRDSCGGIQTRMISVISYDWWIDSYTGNRNNCTNADFSITLRDNRGNTNTSGSFFNGYTYGVVRSAGDTAWFNNRSFTFDIQTRRSLTLVAKDGCGNVKTIAWAVDPKPAAANGVTTAQNACNSFTASVSGLTGFTNPVYCLFSISGTQLSCNNSGTFSGFPKGSYYINIRDNCYDTTIRRDFTVTQAIPNLSSTVTINRTGCRTFNATATGLTNFTTPTYRLYNASNTLIATQTSPAFNNLANGYYCIRIQDGCYDTTISRCFTVADQIPSVNATVSISNAGCTGTSVSIGGQSNLNGAQFCLYTAANVLIACNSNGNFSNVPYGNYCMRIINIATCYDTTILRCFASNRPVPSVGNNISVTRNCTTVNLSISGQSNLTNPQYCLFNAANVQVACNSTGVFNNMPYGTYCINMRNDAACYDTVIRRCVTVNKQIPSIANVDLSNRACNGFTATVSSQNNLSSPTFSLKNSAGTVIATNSTGVFNNVPFGSYCIDMRNSVACYDTLITRCFSSTRPIPNAGSVDISGKTCSTFNADFTGESNVTTPIYYLVKASGDTIATNATGTFNGIAYGNYCIHMRDACSNTSIIRCFTGAPDILTTNISAQASCTVNTTSISVQFSSGKAPYTVNVYDPGNNLVATITSSSSPVLINNLGALPAGLQYRVVGRDNCGASSSKMVTPVVSAFTKSSSIASRCPSGTNQNGSANLVVNVTSTQGTVYPIIIKKNQVVVSLGYTTQSGNSFTWIDLEPATYVVMYNLPGGCTNKVYDTLTVAPYQFPVLNKSAAYQCDNNNFSVGATVSGGWGPFTYQIIGSLPSVPSINTVPQASPVFTITNGEIYSLVRLRVIDACGNATLNDASILPLANMLINASSNCFYNNITMTVDSVPNATYTWYRKTSPLDSIQVGTTLGYTIPYLLPTDTGTYVAKVSVNNGCLTRLSYFEVTGNCGAILPVKEVVLSGKTTGTEAELNWVAKEEQGVWEYVLERSASQSGLYKAIGSVPARNNNSLQIRYIFKDSHLNTGLNYYRLRIVDVNGKSTYSNIIKLKLSSAVVSYYPNPVTDLLNIEVTGTHSQDIRFSLYSISGLLIQEKTFRNIQQQTIRLQRQQIKAGICILKMTDLKTGEVRTEKIIYR